MSSVVAGGETQERDDDYAAVESALKGTAAPVRRQRPRLTDEQVLRLILARLPSQSGSAHILRALRDEEGVACEQARFSRLYKTAVDRRAAT